MGNELPKPTNLLIKEKITAQELVNQKSFDEFCDKHTVVDIQVAAELQIAKGTSGARYVIDCLVETFVNFDAANLVLNNVARAANPLHSCLEKMFPRSQLNVAMKNEIMAVRCAAEILLTRTRDVCCALLMLDNHELDLIIDRKALFDAFFSFDIKHSRRDYWSNHPIMQLARNRLLYAPQRTSDETSSTPKPHTPQAPLSAWPEHAPRTSDEYHLAFRREADALKDWFSAPQLIVKLPTTMAVDVRTARRWLEDMVKNYCLLSNLKTTRGRRYLRNPVKDSPNLSK
jgi:hypothetical protein